MWPVMDQKLARYRELEEQMGDPAVAVDHARYTAVAKELAALGKVVKPYIEYRELEEAIRGAEELLGGDAEMKAMAEEELTQLRPRRDELRTRIEDQLLVDPSEDFSKLIVEIRAGEGGDEAALFAGDLYQMYQKYARLKGWTAEEISYSPGEAGGLHVEKSGFSGRIG